MRIMAIDYGDRRIGLAVSDASGTLCGEAWTLSEWNKDRAIESICAEAASRGVERFVVGLPKNMDGTEGERARICRDFAMALSQSSGLEAALWDERRTSVDAHRILRENGKKTKNHRSSVDAVAASLILEAYLGTL